MNTLALKQLLFNIPDNAVIYIEADHGQQSEQAGDILVTDEEFENNEFPYYGEDIDWKDVEECDVCLITAVLIL